MKFIPLFLLTLILLTPFGSEADSREYSGAMMRAKMAPPQPPRKNPHPPGNAEDQKRVSFAVQQALLKYGYHLEIRHPHIIPWSWKRFQNRRIQTQTLNPHIIVEAQLASVKPISVPKGPPAMAPQVKPDEYMVHAYVRFENDSRWHHLDIILTENSNGEIYLRDFFSIPMPSVGGSLPPGVVC